jgi:hypothetical protein
VRHQLATRFVALVAVVLIVASILFALVRT